MSNDYTSRHVSKRCLMMLGMESLHWWYVGGWGSGAGAGLQGTSSCSGERRGDTRLLPDTVAQLQCSLMLLSCHVTLSTVTHDIIYWLWLEERISDVHTRSLK